MPPHTCPVSPLPAFSTPGLTVIPVRLPLPKHTRAHVYCQCAELSRDFSCVEGTGQDLQCPLVIKSSLLVARTQRLATVFYRSPRLLSAYILYTPNTTGAGGAERAALETLRVQTIARVAMCAPRAGRAEPGHLARGGGLITRTAVRRLVVISQLCYVPVLWHVLPEQPN